ncbi:MAG TPA: DUF4400 domain-containing protein [Gammaproteobacteria bacterium]|nr:DUF4400 domain-containing protein [Gammaproteobacteria bacterium]HVY53940.1 DUF4400 domain-containing protein [Gammaproteobacteria bacterium]
MAASKAPEKTQRKRRGLLSLLLSLVVHLILMSVFAWLVLLIGFGINRVVHKNETGYPAIHAIVDSNIYFLKQHTLLRGENDYMRLQQLRHWITKKTKLKQKISYLQQEMQKLQPLKKSLKPAWQTIHSEIVPLLWGVTSIILTRVFLFILALPLFILCLGLGMVDGLVQRDIRKFQGARESTLLFHEIKRGSHFWFFMPLLMYLLWPWPIAPQWFLVPSALILGLITQLGAKSFKKYV